MEFNLKRMLLVLKRMCMLYFKDLLYLFVVLFAIGVLTPKLFGRETLVFIYGFIVLVILAQFSFREYKTKQGRTAILLLPASNFEKYVAEILFIMLVYPVVLGIASLTGLMAGDLVFLKANTIISDLNFMLKQLLGYEYWDFGFLLIGTASCFALFFGSLLFKRFSALKMFAIFCVGMVGVVVFGVEMYSPESMQWYDSRFAQEYINVFGNIMDLYLPWAVGISAVFFIVIAYLRLTEERL